MGGIHFGTTPCTTFLPMFFTILFCLDPMDWDRGMKFAELIYVLILLSLCIERGIFYFIYEKQTTNRSFISSLGKLKKKPGKGEFKSQKEEKG